MKETNIFTDVICHPSPSSQTWEYRASFCKHLYAVASICLFSYDIRTYDVSTLSAFIIIYPQLYINWFKFGVGAVLGY